MRPATTLDHSAIAESQTPTGHNLSGMNQNETLVTDGPVVRNLSGSNHNETLVAATPVVR